MTRPRSAAGRTAVRIVILAAALGLATAGCTAQESAPTADPTETVATASADTEPVIVDGIGLEIHQNRPDYATRTLQLSITNEGDEPITVQSARFAAPQFTAVAEWTKSTEVPPGLTRSLPVALPAAVCPAPGGPVELTVTVADHPATDSAPMPRTVSAAPADPFGVLARIAGEDCLDEAVAEVATLTLDDTLTVSGTGVDAVAHLTLHIAPGPAPAAASTPTEALTLQRALSTILLRPADGPDWPLDRTLERGDDTVTFTLDVIPARCDPHAVAEDKRGTVLPVELSLADGSAGTVHVSPSYALRLALYDYIAARCGFATG